MAKFAVCIVSYNLMRIYSSLNKQLNASIGNVNKAPLTPTMAAGVMDHAWSNSELIEKIIYVQ
jgi:hypothetical protein